jgi:AhpC/TSA family
MRFPGRRALLAVLALVAVVVAVLLAVLLREEEWPRVEVEAGVPAPALAGSAVRGGEVSLARLRGRVVLVSFLNSRAEATAEGDPSRAQIVFLRSMQTQHARFGLRVIVVDAAEVAGAATPSHHDLVNYTYDWNLDSAIAVLADDGTLAHRFGVEDAPTTFLVGPGGMVRKRWDGFVRAAQLDFAIRVVERRSPTD